VNPDTSDDSYVVRRIVLFGNERNAAKIPAQAWPAAKRRPKGIDGE